MADQITLGYRPGITREAQLRAATQASRTLIDNGYVEYMPMYFTFQGLKPFGGERYYFGLRGDYFGFRQWCDVVDRSSQASECTRKVAAISRVAHLIR